MEEKLVSVLFGKLHLSEHIVFGLILLETCAKCVATGTREGYE